MNNESRILLDKLAALDAGSSPVEVSLSPSEALMAGCFAEDALTAEDAAESILSGEASHG